MKIQSISVMRPNTSLKQMKYCSTAVPNYSVPIFTGYDSLLHKRPFAAEISSLKKDIDVAMSLFQEQYGTRFKSLGQIGYESQEKVKLAEKLERQLLNKKINAADNETFVQFENKIFNYKKYLDNIKNFEYYKKTADMEPYSFNPAIAEIIDINKEYFTNSIDAFSKQKDCYDILTGAKNAMFDELDKVDIKNIPEAFEKIKTLKDNHTTALGFFLFSDYAQMTDINKEYSILTGADKNANDFYTIPERISRLRENIQKFNENTDERRIRITEIDKFLNKYKSSTSKNISAEEIRSVYAQLMKSADKIISKYVNYLNKYNINPQSAADKIRTERILAQQDTVNAALAALIQKEKEEIYRKSYEEFNKLYF